MMEIKLVALDLDGTLLNPQLNITQNAIGKLNKLMDKNVEVVICTGRTLSELPAEFKEMPKIKYYITSNGAVIWDRHELKIIYDNPIPAFDVAELMHILHPYDMRIEVFALGRIFISQKCYARFYEYGGENHDDFLLKTRTPVDNIEEFVRDFNQPVDKFNLFFKSAEDRQKAWEDCVAYGFHVTSSFEQNMEVNATTANKGVALKALAQKLGIPAHQIMAMGDNLNDMTMLRYVGHPIAMGNAVTEVKDLATYVTKANSEDGVAYAVEKLLLEGETDGNLFF
ncbi:MAG: HAD family phosphatase [Kurthia sp.]|nr:HAD family phosphatase [Candidatus Kurthia equi]